MNDHLKAIRAALELIDHNEWEQRDSAIRHLDALEAAMKTPVAWTRKVFSYDREFREHQPNPTSPEWRPLFAAPPAQQAQPKEPTRQSEWANVPKAFNDWWNDDYDDSTNPFRVNSAAYWAWAGWSAAQQAQPSEPTQASPEDMAVYKAIAEGYHKDKQAQAEAVPQDDEALALDLLAKLFDAYENGPACYEAPDEHAGFLGNAVRLDDDTFHTCADLLNRRRPIAAAPQPKETDHG